ncbi:hypothetical protein BGX38DRAFT_1261755 [Terfezia claveryi]|nr:hypothetical protein BGX38DRAFT_1261755 [Terfezia claveryi]
MVVRRPRAILQATPYNCTILFNVDAFPRRVLAMLISRSPLNSIPSTTIHFGVLQNFAVPRLGRTPHTNPCAFHGACTVKELLPSHFPVEAFTLLGQVAIIWGK